MGLARQLPRLSRLMTENLSYCADLVAGGDEDFALTLPYMRAEDRPRITALFALQIELRRIPGAVSEPPLGEIRLQWWRDALDEVVAAQKGEGRPRAHPVVQALYETNAITPLVRALGESAIDSQAPYFYGDGFSSIDALAKQCLESEGWIALAAIGEPTHGDDSIESVRDKTNNSAINEAATSYALARFGPRIAPQLADATRTDAASRLRRAAPALRALDAGEASRVLFLALARGYLKRPAKKDWVLMKRIALFKAMATGQL